jgi:hypothetical protein
VTTQPSLTPAAFAAKWHGVTTTEKASAQEHFIDLCRMLGEPTPHEADPIGAQYAFEKRVSKAAGGDGFADVWKRDFFAWEYKGRNKDLRAAYVQLMGYKDDLGNPPLLVVSDLERIEIHTNFTGLSPIVKLVTLEDLAADDPSDALQLLRDVFTAPEELRPRIQPAQITEQAARHVAEIPRASARAATIHSGWPTSWTGSCSASSRKTRGCSRRGSSRACRRPPAAARTCSRRPWRTCSRR